LDPQIRVDHRDTVAHGIQDRPEEIFLSDFRPLGAHGVSPWGQVELAPKSMT
jgi:hypothetical protein